MSVSGQELVALDTLAGVDRISRIDLQIGTPMGTLNDILGPILTASGMEPVGGPGLYRGTSDSEISPGRRHNVFISLENDSEPEMMSPIGPVANLTRTDIDACRNADDGCLLAVIVESVCLTRPIDISRSFTESRKFNGALIDDSIALAKYADLVEDRLNSRQDEKTSHLNLLQEWLNNDELISSGMVSVDTFLATADRALILIPNPELLDELQSHAVNASLLQFANSDAGDDRISDQTWNHVLKGLEQIRAKRGWPEPNYRD